MACDKVSPVFAGEALEDQTQRHCKSPSAAKPSSEAPDCDGARSSLFSRRTGKEEERNLQHLQQKPGKEEEQDEARGVKEDPESRGLVLQKPGDGTTSGAVPNLLEVRVNLVCTGNTYADLPDSLFHLVNGPAVHGGFFRYSRSRFPPDTLVWPEWSRARF